MGANAEDNDRGGRVEGGEGSDHDEAVGSAPAGVNVVAASVLEIELGTGGAADISEETWQCSARV